MKIATINGARDIRLGDMSDEEPGPNQILLDVTAVGICGSDLHAYLLGNTGGIKPEGPLILGHEASGVVVATGPNVDKKVFRVGQRVAIDPATPCYTCERCKAGDEHLCLRLAFMGLWPYHGAMRQRMVHAASSCIPVPDSVSDASAALLEPLGVALHGNRLGQIQVGEDVLIIGCGGIGLLLIRLARLAGARHIIVADRFAWRLDLAANFGADVICNTDKAEVVEEVLRATDKRGVDVAFEAAWVTQTASQCVDAVRNGGRVVVVGIPAEETITVPASPARRKEVKMVFSRRMKHTYPAAIALVGNGQVSLDTLATHRFPLTQTAKAFETAATYADSVVRAMVFPNEV